MRSSTLNLILALVLICGFIGFNSVFVINEGTVGIVTRFGKVLRNGEDSAVTPGLHFKIPFIDKVKVLDARIQTLSARADRFVTAEKKDLIIDSYVKWKISDAATFYLTTAGGNVMQAEELLRRRINNSLRSQIGRLTIHEIVTGQSKENPYGEKESTFDSVSQQASSATIEDGENLNLSSDKQDGSQDIVVNSKRDQVMQNALRDLGEGSHELGIQIVDVRIKQINLPPEVSNSIYQRMRAERDAVAKLHRSQGRREAETIRAQADREVAVKIATAEREARLIMGQGDAEATRIYAKAYTKSPSLFDFLRSLDAYRNSMTQGKDVLVLKPDSEFFRYFNSPDGITK